MELMERSQGRDFFTSMAQIYTQEHASHESETMEREPQQAYPAPIPVMDFAGIASGFPSVVAWIVLENTVINYPIVQGDDNAFYLTHLPNGQPHQMGSIFMDYRNSPDFSDKNTLIYGHNMASGDMFAILKHYRSQAFFETHQTMTIMTPQGSYTLVLFAAYVMDSAMETVPIHFDDNLAFEAFVIEAMQRSDFYADVDVTDSDRIVTLVTCVDAGPVSYRYVVVGRLR